MKLNNNICTKIRIALVTILFTMLFNISAQAEELVAKHGNLTKERALAANNDADNWMLNGRTYGDKRFSPLTQINDSNVEQLGLIWSADIASVDGLSATPLVIDGVIYMSAPFALVYALDAKTGETIWQYNPNVKLGLSFANGWTSRINRGAAVWEGKVYVATGDCRLIALNATTGSEIWTAQACNAENEDGMDGAPRVVNGKVYIGSGVSDFGSRGNLAAFDANTGKELWRFWTVPGDPKKGFETKAMQMASKTWSEGGAKNGGASVWGTIVYDPEFNSLIFGTDSAAPLNAHDRDPLGGDNLFTNSIVALDADTGEYKWHYQPVPHDAWDYNTNMPMILAELKIDGKIRKVLMQAPKSGFFYVIDRTNGEFISAENFVPTSWASHYDKATGRPVELPGARYYRNKNGRAIVYPGIWGGHNWQPMSFNPDTGLVYFSAWNIPALYETKKDAMLGGLLVDSYVLGTDKETLSGRGSLIAWDPVLQTARWKVPQALPMNGGTLTTAGNLVFHGTATGEVKAYSADAGQLLWSAKTGSSIQAGPITYGVAGQQIILVPVGAPAIARNALPEIGTAKNARGPSRLLAYALGGKAQLPPAKEIPLMAEPPKRFNSKETIAHGKDLFNMSSCWVCHGQHASGFGGTAPNLRRSPILQSKEAWYQVVVEGVKSNKGMLGQSHLSKSDAEAMRGFVIEKAWEEYQSQTTK
ncbi:MAG: PQQ-dependent dehydrogenase, methanol/ethanol family [Gammaproteobacteria bacterium]|jgi:quinohemoprotein ethanol dehydrogenase|nr:PQQ-dependent dehydrogenase, methanol/ethanol family [Gammaproteobacteria bacterium]